MNIIGRKINQNLNEWKYREKKKELLLIIFY